LFQFDGIVEQLTREATVFSKNVSISFLLVTAWLFCSCSESAPDYQLIDVQGGSEIRLTQNRNKYIFVEFWATWCGPCLKSISSAQRLQQMHGDKVEVVLVNSHEPKQTIIKYQNEHGIQCRMAQDDGGRYYAAQNTPVLPYAILYSPNNEVAWSGNPYYLTESAINAFLAGDPAAKKYLRTGEKRFEMKVGEASQDSDNMMEVSSSKGGIAWIAKGKELELIVTDLFELAYAKHGIVVVNKSARFGPFLDVEINAENFRSNSKVAMSALVTLESMYELEFKYSNNQDTVTVDYKNVPK
jgi:thiol-disulfide isomerase/thioredoxin